MFLQEPDIKLARVFLTDRKRRGVMPSLPEYSIYIYFDVMGINEWEGEVGQGTCEGERGGVTI